MSNPKVVYSNGLATMSAQDMDDLLLRLATSESQVRAVRCWLLEAREPGQPSWVQVDEIEQVLDGAFA